VEPPEEDDNAGTCIICVGSTGTGKSSTIAKYTGNFFAKLFSSLKMFFIIIYIIILLLY
jgi:flagellar biosynthesis GTPase FlhF